MAGEIEVNKIYNMDCLDGLKKISDDSIDLIVTDPPYGLEFMGKDWDKAVPSVDIWKECLRVLKSGAFAFVMCIPRQDCLARMIVNLGDVGFNTSFTSIYWTFASGFPKSMNISKVTTKKVKPEKILEIKLWLADNVAKSGKTKSEINKECGFTACSYLVTKDSHDAGGRATWHTLLPFGEKWKIMKKVIGFNDRYDNLIKQLGKITEQYSQPKENKIVYGKYSGIVTEYELTSQAKSLDGSFAGFQPKPAVEIIIVAMKPLSEKTFVDQALKNRKGIVWFDECKIPFSSEKDMKSSETGYTYTGHQAYGKSDIYGDAFKRACQDDDDRVHPSLQGRFPANLLVSDDVLNDGRIIKGEIGRANRKTAGKYNASSFKMGVITDDGFKDSGSFSRYFDLDAWWQERFKKLPKEVQNVFPFLIVPKASKSEKNKGLECFKEQVATKQFNEEMEGKIRSDGTIIKNAIKHKNIHPTCKPIELMSYLITLGSREKDIVLDPFVGSGTTCIAAKMLSRKFIGMDINSEYVDIAKNRLKIISNIDDWL